MSSLADRDCAPRDVEARAATGALGVGRRLQGRPARVDGSGEPSATEMHQAADTVSDEARASGFRCRGDCGSSSCGNAPHAGCAADHAHENQRDPLTGIGRYAGTTARRGALRVPVGHELAGTGARQQPPLPVSGCHRGRPDEPVLPHQGGAPGRVRTTGRTSCGRPTANCSRPTRAAAWPASGLRSSSSFSPGPTASGSRIPSGGPRITRLPRRGCRDTRA